MIRKFFNSLLRRSTVPVHGAGSVGWIPLIRESYSGAWQRGEQIDSHTTLAYAAVFACVSLIASDISKMRLVLVQHDPTHNFWAEIRRGSPFLPVLKKPNRYQNRIQFIEQWVISLMTHGNAFVLKERDNRGVVTALYVLNPALVQTLVTEDGGVYYRLSWNPLTEVLEQSTVVPAREMIHSRINCLWHPLMGVSPIYACGLAAMQGRRIQEQSSRFFKNRSNPSGILTAPGNITPEMARELRRRWEEGYSGENAGRVAVLGDGLKFDAVSMTAVDSQLIEQLQWSAEDVARAFRVPGYKIGVGALPSSNNVAALDQQYYSQCLQSLIEGIELCLDEGLELPQSEKNELGVEFDVDSLIRMDPETRNKVLGEAINRGWMAPNEARRKVDLPPVEGGDTPYLQQQNYSLAALARRDSADNSALDAQPIDVDLMLSELYSKAPEDICRAD